MGKGEGKGEGVGQIAANKGDYLVCTSCLLCNTYIDTSPSTCGSGTAQYCCEACDFVCVGVDSGIPMACGGQLLPGCYCYPKLACCKTAGKMLPDKAEAFGQKENWLMCGSCCCGPLGYGNSYCVPPTTLCTCELKTCCIFVCDAALPCSPDVPCMLTLLPMCVICSPSPTCKCCKTLRGIKPEGVAPGGPVAVELPEAAGSPSAADAVAVRPLKKWVPEHLRPREAAPVAEVLER